MPSLKTYDIFISHAWAHTEDYARVVKFLNDARNFKWRNYSVPSHDPVDANNKTKLKEALRRQMKPANAMLIISGMYAAYSDWIEFEMEFGAELSKPMIGIRPWGQQRTPQAVQNAVKEMVGWNQTSIVSAVRKHSL